MFADRILKGGTIGIFCPSQIAEIDKYTRIRYVLNSLGFNVIFGDNIYRDTYGYIASEKERADDLNSLIHDPSVSMILFGGGDCGVDILPYIDYEAIKKHPKLFCSFSDATSILNAIYSMTGVVTYYGPTSSDFVDISLFNYEVFLRSFVEGYKLDSVQKNSEWLTINGGSCEGILIGGYLPYFCMMLSNRYFNYDERKQYILFIEDNEFFTKVDTVHSYISFIEQSTFFKNVSGVVFGQYAAKLPCEFSDRLKRFASRHSIPVLYTDDFGHGTRHTVMPIGAVACLDADKQIIKLSF